MPSILAVFSGVFAAIAIYCEPLPTTGSQILLLFLIAVFVLTTGISSLICLKVLRTQEDTGSHRSQNRAIEQTEILPDEIKADVISETPLFSRDPPREELGLAFKAMLPIAMLGLILLTYGVGFAPKEYEPWTNTESWKEVKSVQGGFRAKFPSEPKFVANLDAGDRSSYAGGYVFNSYTMELTVTVIKVQGVPSNASRNQIEGYLHSQIHDYWAKLRVDYDTAKVSNLYIGGRVELQSDITDKSTGLHGRVKIVSGINYFHIAMAFSEDPVIFEFFIDNFHAIGQSRKRIEEVSDH